MKRLLLFLILELVSNWLISQTTLTVHSNSAGSLRNIFISNSYDSTAVVNLTITGMMDAQDFRFIRDGLTVLSVLDLSGVTIAYYTGPNGPMIGAPNWKYAANELPYCAFFDPGGTHTGKPTLTSIVLPNSLKNIGEYALQYCHSLTSVSIPISVDTIKYYAFKHDTSLVNTNIPAEVDVIMEGAFQQSGGVAVNAGNTNYSSLDGVLFNKNKTVLICCPYSKYTYSIPASVDTLGFESFNGCRHLASVNIPSTVNYISNGTFAASALVSVNIPSSINRIVDNVFFYCTSLTTVNLPNSISYIGMAAFYGCIKLSSINIPAGVDTIQAMCFNADSSMVSIILPQGLSYLGISVFQKCTHLTSINLPGSLTSLPESLFGLCRSLPTINIPSSITSIGSEVFYHCYSLSSVYAASPVPVDLSSSANVFKGVDTNSCILYVPPGSVAPYESANQWKDFNIIQEYAFGINNASSEKFNVFVENGDLKIWEIPYGENVSVFTLQGIEIYDQNYYSDRLQFRLPAKGIYILQVGRKTVKVVAM